jgi:hypothetical protein
MLQRRGTQHKFSEKTWLWPEVNLGWNQPLFLRLEFQKLKTPRETGTKAMAMPLPSIKTQPTQTPAAIDAVAKT